MNHMIFRADSDGLSEQKRLEGLITRYKAMIPIIESTMVKIDIYTKAYSFREEINKVITEIQQSIIFVDFKISLVDLNKIHF